ncbi:MAG TPA: hypothetical protein PJ984_01680 [Candidatus Saccharibacteria bacterium]|nr:hypothetical protein [Patescibacteria group bacterium]HMS31085.1 hypothetical protein [Candidatus Saccharibacteria bacterium]
MKAHELKSKLGLSDDCISDKDVRRLTRRMEQADTENPLSIYIGSCPDYSNDGNTYTFEDVGGGVPLLTQLQIERNTALFRRMEYLWRPV